MSIQQPMRRPEPRPNLERFISAIDDAASEASAVELTKPPVNATSMTKPPVYGGPQRDAINSCVDGIVGDLCEKISILHKTLDAIEQQVLQSATRSKHSLSEHVAVCIRINDEIRAMQTVVAELAAETHDT